MDKLFTSLNALTESHSVLFKEMYELKETHRDYYAKTVQSTIKINTLQNRLHFFERQYRSKNLIIYNFPDIEDINRVLKMSIEQIFFQINLMTPKKICYKNFF